VPVVRREIVKHDRHEVSLLVVVVTAAASVIANVVGIAVGIALGSGNYAAANIVITSVATAASVVIGVTTTVTATTDEVMHLLRGRNSTLARLQCQVAITTCREQIFARDVIVAPRLFISARKRAHVIALTYSVSPEAVSAAIDTSHERIRLIAFASAKM